MCFYNGDLESLKEILHDIQYTEILLTLRKMSTTIHTSFSFLNQPLKEKSAISHVLRKA